MRISEIDKAMGDAYRRIKAKNGGKKTVAKGKYGYKSIRFLVQDVDGELYGPFKGRGSALTFYQKHINKAGKPTDGVKFYIQEIFKPKDKSRKAAVDDENIFVLTCEKGKIV
jgi:hypothetical protein